MLQRLRSRAALAIGIALLVVGQAALGFVPDAERVTKAVAAANKAAGRAQALRFDLDMRIGDGDVIATGELITHPTGLARLELRAPGGLVERHVLQGRTHEASRNGDRLQQHRAFLPPLFLLQADSKVTLDAALDEFGVRRDVIGLAPCGDGSCFVLGDPGRVVPLKAPEPPPVVEETTDGEPDYEDIRSETTAIVGELPRASRPVLASFATIWIDTESFDVRRIESARGVRTTLGPPMTVEGVRAPSWILIEEPGQSRVRFDITSTTPVNAPAVAFGEQWLMAPPERRQGAPEPGSPAAPPAAAPVDPQRS